MICILLILLVRGCFTLSIYSPLGVSHSHSIGGDQVTHTHSVTNEGNKVTSSSPSLESMLPMMMMMGGSNMGLMIYLILEQEKHSVGHSSSMESLLPFMMMSNNQMMPFMMYLILKESGHIH